MKKILIKILAFRMNHIRSPRIKKWQKIQYLLSVLKKATITVSNIDRFELFISSKPLSSEKLFHKELESTEESTLQSHTVSG